MNSIPKSYFMDRLWRKEQSGDCLVEFLPNIPMGSCEKMISIKPHCFLDKNYESVKCDRVATDFRVQGNVEFKKRNLRAAMELYNQSLRFAEADSENISLAYANRSACFLHMEMYIQCLKDIEMAKENGYPKQLMQKLNDREMICLKQMNDGHTIQAETEPKLSFDPDQHFPCMANVLEIKTNEEFGRHIVAKCDIDVGQMVLVEEPFASVFDSNDRTLCFACWKAIKNFIPCQNCTDVMFCGETCMQNDQIHKITCGTVCNRLSVLDVIFNINAILSALNAFSTVEHLMDFVEKQMASPKLDLPKSCLDTRAEYGMFLKLNVFSAEINEMEIAIVDQVYRCIMNIPALNKLFDSKQKQRFLQHLIWQHRLIMPNALGRRSDGGNYVALGNVQSLFNHSCIPNVYTTTVQKKLCCITVRPVKKGEQLFISYVYYLANTLTGERQKYLLEKFKFECKCGRCVPKINWIDQLTVSLDPLMRQFFALDNLVDRKKSIIKQKCYEFLRKFGHFESFDEIAIVTQNLMSCFDEDYPESFEAII